MNSFGFGHGGPSLRFHRAHRRDRAAAFAEFLIDLQEDRAARTLVIGMLRGRANSDWRTGG
jgi:hypothetical protein